MASCDKIKLIKPRLLFGFNTPFGGIAEEVVQVYGFCIHLLCLPVISVMIIKVMQLSYSERAVPDGRFRHHLFQAVFMQTTYPSRYVYFRWSKVHTAVENAVKAGSSFKPLKLVRFKRPQHMNAGCYLDWTCTRL